ncbi:MAG TPA: DUF1552 domain-containing protein [Bryobacteraceae bacterium]|jgi:hypothetical protein|nr:DUF1552 domain-containing protein [Bryobacteraceae bacterium]
MTIFKKAIPRRALLRGMGATLALPFLDAMVPAFADSKAKPPVRLGMVYVPNGIMMDKWTPAGEGVDWEITPVLQPLAKFRKEFTVISGLAQNQGRPLPGESPGDHPRASGAYLTGVHTLGKKHERDVHSGVSFDQVAARYLGARTQLASLELGIESSDVESACDSGYSCAYNNTISWKTPTTPLPMESNPRRVFERLFGDSDSTDPAERLERSQEDRSILDSMSQAVTKLESGLGAGDRNKLGQYLDAIRDVERRIQMSEQQGNRNIPAMQRPVGNPATYDEHARLMFDLQALAYQCDLTRVGTLMMGREQSLRTYPEIGIADPHHPMTHHNGDPEKIAKVIKINIYHATNFAYYLNKLASTPDGDGTLLDHSIILYGSSLSDGNLHLHNNLPLLVAGNGIGGPKGRHVRYPDGTPMTNLFLTLLDKVGVEIDKLGDSTGKLTTLSV